ncbi:hypothetical protein REPUB_Repub15cG0143200 [Reevesia pubescens]
MAESLVLFLSCRNLSLVLLNIHFLIHLFLLLLLLLLTTPNPTQNPPRNTQDLVVFCMRCFQR